MEQANEDCLNISDEYFGGSNESDFRDLLLEFD